MNFLYLGICFAAVIFYKLGDFIYYLIFDTSKKFKFVLGVIISGLIWKII